MPYRAAGSSAPPPLPSVAPRSPTGACLFCPEAARCATANAPPRKRLRGGVRRGASRRLTRSGLDGPPPLQAQRLARSRIVARSAATDFVCPGSHRRSGSPFFVPPRPCDARGRAELPRSVFSEVRSARLRSEGLEPQNHCLCSPRRAASKCKAPGSGANSSGCRVRKADRERLCFARPEELHVPAAPDRIMSGQSTN